MTTSANRQLGATKDTRRQVALVVRRPSDRFHDTVRVPNRGRRQGRLAAAGRTSWPGRLELR